MLNNLYDLFYAGKSGSTVVKHNALEQFFKRASEVEKTLFKKYIDPDSVSNVGSAMICQAKKAFPTTKAEEPLRMYEMLENREVTGTAAINKLCATLDSLDIDSIEAYCKVLTKGTTGITYKAVNKFYRKKFKRDFIFVFQVQLANTYKPEKDYGVSRFLVTPKLDGLRAYYDASKGELLSRNNKKHRGFEAVKQICQLLCKMFSLKYIDGELYSHEAKFQAISGIVSSHKQKLELKKTIKYVIFAVVGNSAYDNTLEMYLKMEEINATLASTGSEYVEVVPHAVIKNDFNEIINATKNYMKQGYEGSMLRNPNVFYNFKRSNALLKHKIFNEGDFCVIDTFEGKGKYEGMLGGLVVKRGEITSEVGSGFTDYERGYLWSIRDALLGRIVEVKYQEFTDDGSSLRFPVFRKFK